MKCTPTHQLFFNPLTNSFKVRSISKTLLHRQKGWVRVTVGTFEKINQIKALLENEQTK